MSEMSYAVIYSKMNQSMSRERSYCYTSYSDRTAMLTIESRGVGITIHMSKEDVEALGRDFNAG
jgi:hypothetical protein